MDNPIILAFVTLAIFTLMLAIGVNHSFRDVTSLWRRPGLLLRSLLAVLFFVPAVVAILLWVFKLPSAVSTGLAILAASPGAPLTYKRVEMAGGDPTYTASLQLTLALLAVLVTPLVLAFFSGSFQLDGDQVGVFHIVRQVAEVTFLPVLIGLFIQHFAPGVAAGVAKPVRMVAHALFIGLLAIMVILLVLSRDFRMTLNLGIFPYVVITIMVTSSLAIGHLLGGQAQKQRSVLAIATVARNVGLALFIAGLSEDGQHLVPTLVAYMVVGGLIAVPYSVWSKRRTMQTDKGKPNMLTARQCGAAEQ